MRVGSKEWKVLQVWIKQNPKGTVAEWCKFWEMSLGRDLISQYL